MKSYTHIKVFGSSEFVINKSHCSICGLPMQSLECPHIKGELYWGDMAVEIIDNIITFQAVCLVSHPLDKRCVLELADDTRSETKKFKMLNEFISLNIPFLQMFNMKTRKEYRKIEDIKIVGPNELCSCGSGKKFKKCCGQTLYYEHLHCMVTLLDRVKLIML